MGKKKANKPLKQRRITDKAVRESEDLPPPVVGTIAPPEPEADDDPWGEDGLNYRQRMFVKYFVGEAAGRPSRAAEMAGYKSDNRNCLKVTAFRTLHRPNVQRAIEREIGKRFGSAEDIRSSVAAIANGNAADYLSPDSTGKLVVDLDKLAEGGMLGLIHEYRDEGFDTSSGPVVIKRKLKLYDKLRALEILAKIKGYLPQEQPGVNVNVNVTAPAVEFDYDEFATRFAEKFGAGTAGNGAGSRNGNGAAAANGH
jgi:hypothetical protein